MSYSVPHQTAAITTSSPNKPKSLASRRQDLEKRFAESASLSLGTKNKGGALTATSTTTTKGRPISANNKSSSAAADTHANGSEDTTAKDSFDMPPPPPRPPLNSAKQHSLNFYYYRVAFRGVVALLPHLPGTDSAPQQQQSNDNTFYVGQGEVVVSHIPPMQIKVNTNSRRHVNMEVTNDRSTNDTAAETTKLAMRSEFQTPPPTSRLSNKEANAAASVIATSPPPDMPMIGSDKYPKAASPVTDSELEAVDYEYEYYEVIRVDEILTGGYAATSSSTHTTANNNSRSAANGGDDDEEDDTPKRSNMTSDALPSSTASSTGPIIRNNNSMSGIGGLGFIYMKSPPQLQQDNTNARSTLILQRLLPPQQQQNVPRTAVSASPIILHNNGPYRYKVVSKSPLPIRTGPSMEAPVTKVVVLPGTVQVVALRWSLLNDESLSSLQDASLSANNTATNNIRRLWFLRLNHGRGWILSHHRGHSVVQEVEPSPTTTIIRQTTNNGNNNLSSLSNNDHDSTASADEQSSVAASSLVSANHSIASTTLSSLHSLSATASTVRRRHRPPRRRDNTTPPTAIYNNSHHHPRQPAIRTTASSLTDASSTPTKTANMTRFQQVESPSAISVLSEDSNSQTGRHPFHHRHQHGNMSQPPTSPDASYETNNTTITNYTFQQQQQQNLTKYFLIRVNAPRGLKILDAPHFQVKHHLKNPSNSGNNDRVVASSHAASLHLTAESNSGNNAVSGSIFQTMSGRLSSSTFPKNPAGYGVNPSSSSSKQRILPRGALFEASQRMERKSSATTGVFQQEGVSGLIKLSDNTGWAVVPRSDELDYQYRNYHHNNPNYGGVGEDNGTSRAFDEVGNVVLAEHASGTSFLRCSPSRDSADVEKDGDDNSVWVRIQARAGLTVACPPPMSPMSNDDLTSPTSSRGSSAVTAEHNLPGLSANNSGICASNSGNMTQQQQHSHQNAAQEGSDAGASSVGSAVWDAMFRTPKKDPEEPSQETPSKSTVFEKMQLSTTIACGMCVQVEKCYDHDMENDHVEFVRLVGGQGWLPLRLEGRAVFQRTAKPEFRFGSFWFRVQSQRGVKVRWGPSKRSPSIKSEDGSETFRFECGEFLRASEIMTVFTSGEPTECHAKLYRNRHVRLHSGHEEYRQLVSLAAQAEWVQVFSRDLLSLEECADEPKIERHRQGWRYNVIPDTGVKVRRGPSFSASTTENTLSAGESVLVIERVSPAGDKLTWLRLKNGQGWVHDMDEHGNDVMIVHSLRHRSRTSVRARQTGAREEVAYNTIIARLFHNEVPGTAYRPPRDLPSNHRTSSSFDKSSS